MRKFKCFIISILFICMGITVIPWNEVTTAFAETNISSVNDTTETSNTINWEQSFEYTKNFVTEDFIGIEALYGGVSDISAVDEGMLLEMQAHSGIVDMQAEQQIANGTFEVTVVPQDTTSRFGLLMRATDVNNKIYVGTEDNGNEWFWEYWNNGTNKWGTVHSSDVALTIGEEAHIKVELIDDKVTLWVNDTQIFSETMTGSPLLSEGYFGVAKSDNDGSFVIKDYTVNENISLLLGGTEGITRAEWLHNLAIMFDMSIEDDVLPDNYFADLSEDSEYYEDILMNVEFGVVNIPAGGDVQPDELATREFIAQTLNFCLGFQLDGETEYTFNDSIEVEHLDDAQIALNRGWFNLVEGNFEPDTVVTKEELKVMIDDTASVLAESDIDENYDSIYEFSDDVKVVPEHLEVLKDETTITIKNSNAAVSEGQKFAVYFNGIPNVYFAESVTKENNDLIITYSDVEAEEGFENIEAEGILPADITQLVVADGAELVFVNEETQETFSSARAAIQTYGADTINNVDAVISDTFDLGGGTSIRLDAKIKNPKVSYEIKWGEASAFAKFNANLEISYYVKGDLAKATNLDNLEFFTWGVPGVGGLTPSISLELSGKIAGVQNFDITAGISYSPSNGVRIVRGFTAKSFTITAEASGSAALCVKFGITDLPVIDAYIYAEAGGKVKLTADTYADGNIPEKCTHFLAYLYAEVGATGKIELGFYSKEIKISSEVINENNSPIRIVHHYEDGVEVAQCTRGKTYNYLTSGKSKYSSSGWYDGTAIYAYDSNGNPIPLYTYELDENNKATITGYNGLANSLVIPEKLDGYTVIAIGNAAFENKDTIRNISIPNTINAIKSYAFNECDQLESIIIPDSVISIGGGAFAGCDSLNTVVISDFVTYIGSRAFEGCSNLKNVKLSENLEKAGSWIFYNCDSLKYINIPANINEIESTFINNAWRYGEWFNECENLLTVEFSEGISNIPRILNYCKSVVEINIPETATSISSGAFQACSSLHYIDIPESVTFIGADAFESCASLQEIIIPNNVIEIGGAAFGNCTSLNNVVLSSRLTKLGSSAFYNCDSLRSIKIPASVKEIPWTQKYDLPWLTYGKVFAECDNLSSVIFEEGTTKVLKIMNDCKSLTEVIMPDSVISIEESAFENCISLKTVEIPNSVTNIGGSSFRNTALSVVELPTSVIETGSYTFADCELLEKAIIPDSVTTMGAYSFYNCTALKELILSKSMQSIMNSMFENCVMLENIDLPEPITIIKENAFKNCSALKSVGWNEMINEINTSAFENCDSLMTIVIPDSVSKIGSRIFYDCDQLTEITLGINVTGILESAFEHCDNLINITLPYKTEKIGAYAFKDCINFTSITIPRKTITIDSSAFSYPEILTIYGVSGTYAETYANENGINFVEQLNPATEVSLNYTELTVDYLDYYYGQKLTLQLKVSPINFTDEVVWKSTNPEVITIDENGAMTTEGVGTSIIKVTVGDISASCKITVVKSVWRVYLNENTLSLNMLEQYQLKASVDPRDATNPELVWKSSDESVATVDQTGFVSALKKGTATITVETTDGSNISKSCIVTVVNSINKVDSIEQLESPHNYENNCSDSWIYSEDNAAELYVTFDERTIVEDGFDYIYIFDGDDEEIGNYTGDELAGQTIVVKGDTVKIQLRSDGGNNDWGFKVSNIDVYIDDEIIAKSVINQIASIPPIEELELSDMELIEETRMKYDALSDTQKELVENYKILEAAEGKIEELKMSFGTTVRYSGTCGNLDWTIDYNGHLIISGNGNCNNEELMNEGAWIGYHDDILTAEINVKNITDLSYLFAACSNLYSVNLSNLEMQNVTNMSAMFYGCASLTEIDITGFNTENVTDMSFMFAECQNIQMLDLSYFMTENVIDMSYMFYDCSSLTSLTANELDTTSVTNMEGMFYECTELRTLDVDTWNTMNVSNMAGMFMECNSLTSLDIDNWNTGNVTNMLGMFLACYNLAELSIPKDIAFIDEGMFAYCYDIKKIAIPSSVSQIKDNAFYESGVTEIYFEGNAPEFAEQCYDGANVTAYYPENSLGWTADVLQNYGGNVVWVSYDKNSSNDESRKVVEIISKLPTADTITLENKDEIEAAREAYEALTENQKTLVTNLAELEALESKIAELEKVAEKAEEDAKAAKEVNDTIVELPSVDVITLENKAEIEATREAYEALTEDQKKLVTNLVELEALESRITELEEEAEKIEENTKIAKEVDEIIAELPTVDLITLENKTEVEAARSAYEALTDEQKILVENLAVLESIEAKINELESQPIEPVNPFTDVKESDYYYIPVLWAVENNVTAGLSPTEFGPYEACTRAQVVTFLWRSLGRPEPTITESTFKDVPKTAYYYKAVLWAVENNITSGYNAESFGAEDIVTRSQFVTFLWRSKGRPEPTSFDNEFTDIPKNAYYHKAVLWAVENGVTAGYYGTLFAPDISCTRGQVVSFLYRAKED